MMTSSMNIGPLEEAPESLIAYRLGQVEQAVKANNLQVNAKLDDITGISSEVSRLSLRVDNLEKSRDRLIATTSTLVVGIIVLAVQIYFNIGS